MRSMNCLYFFVAKYKIIYNYNCFTITGNGKFPMNRCVQSFDQQCICSLLQHITVLSSGFGQHAEQRTDCDGVVRFSSRRVQNSTLREWCSILTCSKDQHIYTQLALPSTGAAQYHHRPSCCRYSSLSNTHQDRVLLHSRMGLCICVFFFFPSFFFLPFPHDSV